MRAAVFERFGGPITVQTVPDPAVPSDGVVVRVSANGICRSDWHGWRGHDAAISLPHVPGHEIAGIVEAVGPEVRRWTVGDRVTVPFIGSCGWCPPCLRGDGQVCDAQFQPGFDGWGGFAELVALRYADRTLVRLPESLEMAAAASLGCRFATSFRAVSVQAGIRAGEWLAVHGCGGVGLAAIQIARAMGIRVVAVDVRAEALALAAQLGAEATINGASTDVPDAVRDVTEGGAHASIDAVGHLVCARQSVDCLRKRGRHVQVGLLAGEHAEPPLPMGRVIADELEIVGSHGMPAHDYDRLLGMVACGDVDPGALVTQHVGLEQAAGLLMGMNEAPMVGIAVLVPNG